MSAKDEDESTFARRVKGAPPTRAQRVRDILPLARAEAKTWFAPEALIKALVDADIGFKPGDIPEPMGDYTHGITYWALKQGEDSRPHEVMRKVVKDFVSKYPDVGWGNVVDHKEPYAEVFVDLLAPDTERDRILRAQLDALGCFPPDDDSLHKGGVQRQ